MAMVYDDEPLAELKITDDTAIQEGAIKSVSHFPHNIDELANEFQTRKDTVKRVLLKYPFVKGNDYILSKEENIYCIGRKSEIILLSEQCYQQLRKHLIITTRKEAVKQLPTVNIINRYLPKETEIIGFLKDFLSVRYTVTLQHKVFPYRIDLYIHELCIAIECDEFNHQDRDATYEKKRQDYIENKLECKFIRFNPDDPNFKLSKLCADIMTICLENIAPPSGTS